LTNVAGVVLLHSHPSGDLCPSQDDLIKPIGWSNLGRL